MLAVCLLRAGLVTIFLTYAAVVHFHDYLLRNRMRRSFDEARSRYQAYGSLVVLALHQLLRIADSFLGGARIACSPGP